MAEQTTIRGQDKSPGDTHGQTGRKLADFQDTDYKRARWTGGAARVRGICRARTARKGAAAAVSSAGTASRTQVRPEVVVRHHTGQCSQRIAQEHSGKASLKRSGYERDRYGGGTDFDQAVGAGPGRPGGAEPGRGRTASILARHLGTQRSGGLKMSCQTRSGRRTDLCLRQVARRNARAADKSNS